MVFSVNFLPVIIAAVLLMPLGAFIYSEAGLGKMWLEAIGKKREDIDSSGKEMGKLMAVAFLSSLATIYIIGVLIASVGITTFIDLFLLVFLVYLVVFFIRLKGTMFDDNFKLFKVNLIATLAEFVIIFLVFMVFVVII